MLWVRILQACGTGWIYKADCECLKIYSWLETKKQNSQLTDKKVLVLLEIICPFFLNIFIPTVYSIYPQITSIYCYYTSIYDDKINTLSFVRLDFPSYFQVPVHEYCICILDVFDFCLQVKYLFFVSGSFADKQL